MPCKLVYGRQLPLPFPPFHARSSIGCIPLLWYCCCIAGWVNKKVEDLLGKEPTFCSFIMEQLAGHVSAEGMLSALADVLDEDAEPFTLKLWQILIYEQLKLTHGG